MGVCHGVFFEVTHQKSSSVCRNFKTRKNQNMTEEKIQTLHPQAGKTNKRISKEKYEFIKSHILTILATGEHSHSELMEHLYARVKDDFDGGVQWYGETVKLDLEARKMIERKLGKPQKYRLYLPHA